MCYHLSKICFLFCFLIAGSASTAQLKPVYEFQVDDTLLKRKYFNEALLRKKVLMGSITTNSKDYKEAYNNMFETIGQLLISTRTVTEKVANDYIKAVVDKIIRTNPELTDLQLRVVFSRDYSPNAYSIGDGTIAFNAGLFVYLDNEAEMAFTLCHEIAHYYLGHSQKRIDKIIRIANSDSLKQVVKKLSKEEYNVGVQAEKLFKSLQFDIRKHSRDGEEEADRVGLRFYEKTGYNGNGFIDLMKLLDKVDDTSLFSKLNLKALLSFPGSTFKDKWIKKESAIFSALDPEEASELTKRERDSLKTHPDCQRRIELLKESTTAIQGTEYLVNEELFQKLKRDFIPELLNEIYNSNNLSLNLYLSLQMLQDGKYLPLAIYSIVRDLNLLYKNQKDHMLGMYIDSENNRYADGYNDLLRMLAKIKLYEIPELNVAICQAYKETMSGYDGFQKEFNQAIIYKSQNK
jgi:Zn-dependent protease with chaperone function